VDNRAPRIYDCLRGSNQTIASVSDPSETDYFQRRQRSTERLIERLTEQSLLLVIPLKQMRPASQCLLGWYAAMG
jgi:hypothetical protein